MSNEYCMYLRKSRADAEAEARGEEEILSRHERTLLDLSKKLKLHVTKIFREVVSGETISNRPEVQQLLEEVEEGRWAGVLVMEIERLARGDTVDQGIVAQTFKYSSTKIITPTKTYDPDNEFDEEYFEFGLFMSRREYKTINRRQQRGRTASIKEGKYLGSKPPYGYERIKLEGQKGYSLVPNIEQAPIVKFIFELYTKGEPLGNGTYNRLGTSLIARKLNALKVPTAKGGNWVTSTINGILRNPVYMGKIKWGSRPMQKKRKKGELSISRPRVKLEEMTLVDGLHEGLVSEEVWNLAQELLAQNPARPIPTKYKVKNPLMGLVICGECGRKMIRRPYSKKDLPSTLMCQDPQCTNVSSHLHLVEKKIIEGLKTWLINYKAEWKKIKQDDGKSLNTNEIREKAIAKINNQISSLELQMNNLHDLLEQGIYSTEKFIERSKNISERIKKYLVEKEELEKEIKTEEAVQGNNKEIVPVVERVIETYYLTDNPEMRNNLLKSVLVKVIYKKEYGTRWHRYPDDFELTLHPKILQNYY